MSISETESQILGFEIIPVPDWEVLRALSEWGVVLGPRQGDSPFHPCLSHPKCWKISNTELPAWFHVRDELGKERAVIICKSFPDSLLVAIWLQT